jgi:hypothetical protein
MASAATSPVLLAAPSRRACPWTTLTTTLSTSLLLGVAGCASEPQPSPPRPVPAARPAPSSPVAPPGSRSAAPASPAPRPSPTSATPDDELPPPLEDGPGPSGEARERDERIAQLEREARAGSRSPSQGAPAPRGDPSRDDRTGRGEVARRGTAERDADLDPELDALLTRANQAVQDREWSTYAACFSPESQRLIASSWAVASGVAAWANDRKPDKNSKGIAKILWLTVGKCGVTRASIVEVAEGRATPRAALEAHRQASRDPRRSMDELGPSLPFAEHEAFLGRARLEGPRGKGAGASVVVRTPDGLTVVELQHGPAGGFVLHIKDVEAWLTRLDRALTVRIAAKE